MNVQNAMWPDKKSWGENAGELVTSNSMYWVGLESKMGHEEKTNKQTKKTKQNKTNKQTNTGWWFQPLSKNMKVSWDDYSQDMEK